MRQGNAGKAVYTLKYFGPFQDDAVGSIHDFVYAFTYRDTEW